MRQFLVSQHATGWFIHEAFHGCASVEIAQVEQIERDPQQWCASNSPLVSCDTASQAIAEAFEVAGVNATRSCHLRAQRNLVSCDTASQAIAEAFEVAGVNAPPTVAAPPVDEAALNRADNAERAHFASNGQ